MNVNKKKIITISLIVGFIIPLLAWALCFYQYDYDFSILSLGSMHLDHAILFLIDLIPFLFAVIASYIIDKSIEFNKDYESLNQKLEKQTENINKVATFAEKIGNGQYDAVFDDYDENDTLSKTILNLRDKLYENNKQESMRNWIMVGKDKISNILRLHNDLNLLSYEVLVTLIKYIKVVQGAFYIYNEETRKLKIISSYAYNRKKYLNTEIKLGEGLVGQAAIEQDIIYRTEIPQNYVTITSGILGDKKPQSLLIVPLITEEKLQGALEFASFVPFQEVEIDFIKEIGEIIARAIYNLQINEKTERLLKESQQMTAELKEREEELRQNAEEMQLTQEELEKTNANLEEKIQEVNRSQARLHALLENASELIMIYDKNKKLKYVSPSVIRILGYNEEEIANGKDFDRVNVKGQKAINMLFEELLNNPDKPQQVEYTYLHKDGSRIFLEATGRNLIHDPAISGLILNISDVTERKRAEKEERMRGAMQSLSENSPDLIIRMDANGHIFYCNPVIELITGLKVEDFIKKNLKEIPINQTIINTFEEIIHEVISQKDKINKEVNIPSINEERIMNVNAIPEYNEEKKLETILFVLHDITERKQIELMIQEKNQKITESINYAHRIQECILPNNKIIQQVFKQSFIFYKPKDVVSGDFPYFFRKGDDIYIAVIDCTGHGVPGAMLSMIGYFLLNQILNQPANLNPGEILDQLHAGVIKTLRQDQEGASARDGMDAALCKINLDKKELQFAGAHRPLYQIRNGELFEYKATKSAIGGIPREGSEPIVFKNYELTIEKDDLILFFSDGIVDQFGGPEGMKLGPKRIKEIALKNLDLSMNQLFKTYRDFYTEWIGNEKQIDDVLMIGIRF